MHNALEDCLRDEPDWRGLLRRRGDRVLSHVDPVLTEQPRFWQSARSTVEPVSGEKSGLPHPRSACLLHHPLLRHCARTARITDSVASLRRGIRMPRIALTGWAPAVRPCAARARETPLDCARFGSPSPRSPTSRCSNLIQKRRCVPRTPPAKALGASTLFPNACTRSDSCKSS